MENQSAWSAIRFMRGRPSPPDPLWLPTEPRASEWMIIDFAVMVVIVMVLSVKVCISRLTQ